MLYPLSFIRKKLVIDGIVCSQCLKVLGCEGYINQNDINIFLLLNIKHEI